MADTPERAGREGDSQPLPTPGTGTDIHSLVIADIEARRAIGIKRYGMPLQAHNGRDALIDLYEELLDACSYLKQLLVETAAVAEPSLAQELLDESVQVLAPDARFIRAGFAGKKVGWLDENGHVRRTTLLVDQLEVPRCRLTTAIDALGGGAISEMAERAAADAGMQLVDVVFWPAADAWNYPFPESIGMLLVEATR